MIDWFSHKKNAIATSALALFVGGWLLLLCQTCLAYNVAASSNFDTVISEESVPCHSNHDMNAAKADTKIPHCHEVCNCNSVDASLNTTEPVHEIKRSSIDHYPIFLLKESELSQRIYIAKIYPVDRSPEQAIHLPFDNYTVLLN